MKLKHLLESSYAERYNLTKCSIGMGYCEETKKWHGYSHRGGCAFGIGDKIFDHEYGDENTPFVKRGKETIKTDADAKLAAKKFAAYVS